MQKGIIYPFNPLSPNIHIKILHTDLYTFPLRISKENLIKDQSIFSWVIILLILITSSHDNVWISLKENCCWSLLALKGLSPNIYIQNLQTDLHTFLEKYVERIC